MNLYRVFVLLSLLPATISGFKLGTDTSHADQGALVDGKESGEVPQLDVVLRRSDEPRHLASGYSPLVARAGPESPGASSSTEEDVPKILPPKKRLHYATSSREPSSSHQGSSWRQPVSPRLSYSRFSSSQSFHSQTSSSPYFNRSSPSGSEATSVPPHDSDSESPAKQRKLEPTIPMGGVPTNTVASLPSSSDTMSVSRHMEPTIPAGGVPTNTMASVPSSSEAMSASESSSSSARRAKKRITRPRSKRGGASARNKKGTVRKFGPTIS